MFKRAEEQVGARTCLQSGSKKATELDAMLQFDPNSSVQVIEPCSNTMSTTTVRNRQQDN